MADHRLLVAMVGFSAYVCSEEPIATHCKIRSNFDGCGLDDALHAYVMNDVGFPMLCSLHTYFTLYCNVFFCMNLLCRVPPY